MRILIVDDDAANARLLKSYLLRDGHTVDVACNGQEGVDAFLELSPDLILMDYLMPVMSGLDATRLIKQHCPDNEFVPVLFLTAFSEEDRLAQCVEAGGDDFLSKPFSRTVLRAKIRSLERIRSLHKEVESQRAALQAQQLIVQKDLEVAKQVMTKIVRSSSEVPCLSYRVEGMESFSGDCVLANRTPTGGFMVFLGDFTGHGLPAAVGAIPVSESFYAMSGRGFSVAEIAVEINAKLNRMLPCGFFCAAALIEVDPIKGTAVIWNGGLPDVLVLDSNHSILGRVPSTHLALGVDSGDPHYRHTEVIELSPTAKIFACSDGVVESWVDAGGMLGDEGLARLLGSIPSGRDLVGAVFDWLGRHRDEATASDDVSVLAIDLGQPINIHPAESSRAQSQSHGEWEVTWRLEASTIKRSDLLPIIMRTWRDFPAPQKEREKIYLILAELFNNSLEHGLLGLDSALKKDAEGFSKYYAEKERRLEELQSGAIEIRLAHTPNRHGGEVSIMVEDTGPGFVRSEANASLDGNLGHAGRGLALIEELCDSVNYNSRGNRVEVIFNWSYEIKALAAPSQSHSG